MKRSIQTRTWKRRKKIGKFYMTRLKKGIIKTRKSLLKKRVLRTKTRLASLPKGRSREGLRVRG